LRSAPSPRGGEGWGEGDEAPVLLRSYPLHEHRAPLPAADADRRDAAAPAGAREDIEHVHDDPGARRADRVPERDRAAVDVELRRIDRAERTGQAELVATECFILPRVKACEHLRGERLVDLPRVDVGDAEPVTREH